MSSRASFAQSKTGSSPPAKRIFREVLSFALRTPHFSGPLPSLPAKSTQIVRQYRTTSFSKNRGIRKSFTDSST
jgi:hypothetical protein